MATQRKKASVPVPSDPMELLRDIHARVVRIETRQAREMLANGMDFEGKQLPTPDPVRPARRRA